MIKIFYNLKFLNNYKVFIRNITYIYKYIYNTLFINTITFNI